MHWLMDVVFKEDLSRYRAANRAKKMATIRRFTFNLVRHDTSKGSVKSKRNAAE